MLASASSGAQTPPAAPWRSDGLCGARLPAFEPAEIDGCQQDAFCAAADPQTRVCVCPIAEDPQKNNVQIALDYQGKRVKTWLTEVAPVSLGPDAFRLDAFGSTPQGTKQVLLGVMHGQSNGMARQSWSVWSLAAGQRSEVIQLEDYGLISFATRPKGSQHCQLLASQWTSPAKGGLFAVGQWHDLRQGKFLPSPDKPVITRRYRYRFENQRMAHQTADKPLRWYADPDTQAAR